MESHTCSTDCKTSMKETEQAFKQMKSCITKMQLIEKAKNISTCREVILAVENMPEKDYSNAGEVIKTFSCMRNVVEALCDMEFPANKVNVLDNCKSHNCQSEVITALDTCADREYINCSDVMTECIGKIHC
jgi:Protein of unknown function (DUF2795)